MVSGVPEEVVREAFWLGCLLGRIEWAGLGELALGGGVSPEGGDDLPEHDGEHEETEDACTDRNDEDGTSRLWRIWRGQPCPERVQCADLGNIRDRRCSQGGLGCTSVYQDLTMGNAHLRGARGDRVILDAQRVVAINEVVLKVENVRRVRCRVNGSIWRKRYVGLSIERDAQGGTGAVQRAVKDNTSTCVLCSDWFDTQCERKVSP